LHASPSILTWNLYAGVPGLQGTGLCGQHAAAARAAHIEEVSGGHGEEHTASSRSGIDAWHWGFFFGRLRKLLEIDIFAMWGGALLERALVCVMT
jgi:hypothetical protein